MLDSYYFYYWKLQEDLASANTNEEKWDIIDSFSNRFMTSYEFWEIIIKGFENDKEKRKEILTKAIFHFCNDPEFQGNNLFHIISNFILHRKQRCCIFPSNSNELIKLSFPHGEIGKFRVEHEKFLNRSADKKAIELSKKQEKLYWKIMAAAKNDGEIWFNLLIKSEHYHFIKYNVEHRIGIKLSNLTQKMRNFISISLGEQLDNKKLWKLYIEYLREIDPKEMLQVYSKYCRFFLDDFEMKNEYKNAAEKYGPVLVSWKNPFEFEVQCYYQSQISPTEKIINSYYIGKDETIMNKNTDDYALLIFINDFIPSRQTWPLPKPIFRYIIEKANHKILRNLYQTCKYFFNAKPHLICYNLNLDIESSYKNNYMKIKDESLEIQATILSAIYLENIWLTGNLSINGKENLISYLLKNNKIYRCDARFLELTNQKITFYEFEKLVGHGKVESLYLCGTTIQKDEDKAQLILEEVLEKIPKIIKFCYNHEEDDLKSNQTLSKLFIKNKNKNKIAEFEITNVIDICIIDFCEFIKNRAAPYSKTFICTNLPLEIRNEYTTILNDSLKEWENFDGKPQVSIY